MGPVSEPLGKSVRLVHVTSFPSAGEGKNNVCVFVGVVEVIKDGKGGKGEALRLGEKGEEPA